MKAESENRGRWTRAWIIFGCWTLFGLFFACQRYVERAYAGTPTSWAKVLTAWAACAYLWAALTPFVLWFARRFPFGRGRWARALPAHAAAGALVSVLQLGAYLLALQLLLRSEGRAFASFGSWRHMVVAEFHFNILLYTALVALGHGLNHYRQKREREIAAARFEAELAQAQLEALRLRLQPHFLFNALNTISVLMLKDVGRARRTLGRLSELLRALLRHSEAHEVTLRQELEFLENYLEIERERFPDRLEVSIDVDPAVLDARVPSLILQPVVENAIKHGIAPRAEAGRIEIRAERLNGTVRVRVHDDGPGLPLNVEGRTAGRVGLSNTKERLERMYGGGCRLELGDAPGGGTVVSISIPLERPRA
ncbi:MAG TPA: histidine kinase [Pyrinomonadaceae bacterium]|jgi:signal transduction histidine kinase